MPQAQPDPERGVYGISVAAELVGMGTQTLRLYESRGLLDPSRSDGGTRRYSDRDLDRLRRIGQLLEQGLNLAGVAAVLRLETENAALHAEKLEHHWATSTPKKTRQPPAQPPTRSPKQ